MKRLARATLATLACAFATGCATYSVGASSPGGPVGIPPAGASASSGSVGLQISSGSTIGMIIAAGILGAAWHGSEDRRFSDRVWMGHDSALYRPPPPLDERRRVHEQSCAAPIEDASANLRCK